jgi:D-cysteine desulfhydrase
VEQLPKIEYLVTASGSGGTHSGLLAGFTAIRSPMKIIGISTRQPEAFQVNHIRTLAEITLNHIYGGVTPCPVTLPEDSVVVKDLYVGPGYSLPTEGMAEAVTLFARTEGILLDPVYSGKAAAGMIDLVRSGFFPDGSNVMFMHTGGAPSLYHYQPLNASVPGVAGAGQAS